MKIWNEELDEKLTNLVNEGKSYKEIALLMNMSYKAVSVRGNRLGIKSKYKEILSEISNEECTCKNCETKFIALKKQNQQFCSQQCSGSYNTKGRKHSKETKEKIKQSNTGKKQKKESIDKRVEKFNKTIENRQFLYKKINFKKEKSSKKRVCKNCSNDVLFKKTICEECRVSYYKYYRPSCEFDFNIFKYKEKFDFLLVEKNGWYSPLNKKNNPSGVSRDHLYSVKDGFINKIDPKFIKHPANCQLILQKDNNIKNSKSSISFEELLKRIEKWDSKEK